MLLMKLRRSIGMVQQQKKADGSTGDDSGCTELLQGLRILERLASNHHNWRDICTTPGLLPKITAPLYSDTLIQYISIGGAWPDIVNRSFKVLHWLIRAPGWTGRRLRQEISCNNLAVSNLESILDQSNGAGQELQMRAMEILTELALDLSINLTRETKENLIKKQLQIFLADESGEQIFLADESGEEHEAMLIRFKATAGRALALLSTNSENNSNLIMTAYNDIVGRLTEILDANNIITYRTTAAEILENLCCHHHLDKNLMKETLLPKVLAEILPSKREPPQSNNSAMVNDEENQIISAPGNNEANNNISAQGDNTEIQEISSSGDQNKSSGQGNEERTTSKEIQQAFLSLTLVIYAMLDSPDDFNEAIEKIALGHDAFVLKLKTLVEQNCQATADSLRIVKLCGQIAVSMMRRNQYIVHFKDQEFVKSLSKASKIMSNLESCILFAGTDLGPKKTVSSLLSDIEKKAKQLVG